MEKNKEEENLFFLKQLGLKVVEIPPGIGFIVQAIRTFISRGSLLRRDRAIEWLMLFIENPSIITEEIMRDQNFIDGCLYLCDRFLRERNEEKRKMIKDILLGYAKSHDFINFRIERFSFVIEQLTVEDLKVIFIFSDGTVENFEKKQPGKSRNSQQSYSCLQYGKLMLSGIKGLKEFEEENYTYEIMKHLESLGIVSQPVATWGAIGSGGSNDNFRLSEFGKDFIQYIFNNKKYQRTR